MKSKAPSRSVEERALEAETKANQWLADGNDALESGNQGKADRCFDKAQFWLDRANLLSGQADRNAPRK